MANTTPTKLGIFEILYLIILAIFLPKVFAEKERQDEEKRKELPESDEPNRLQIVRMAFFKSFVFIIITGIIGISMGSLIDSSFPDPNSRTITWLQIVAASILLWATIAVRGWDILSYSGVRLSERLNRWIFRSLYFIGTLMFIVSMIWK